MSAFILLVQTALELGLIMSLVVMALYLSYSMLDVCDLSTDGCYTLGAAVGAMVALTGHPFLAIFAAMGAGIASGFITAFVQTKMGVDSLIAGIVVNTGLYSINMWIMGGKALQNMNTTDTVFTKMESLLENTALAEQSDLIVILIFVVIIAVILMVFMKTKMGLAIRATGNNPAMVKSSSINPIMTTIVGLCIANAFTGLSGCLMAMSQKYADINMGTGTVTIALASLLIGRTIFGRCRIPLQIVGAIVGAILFRLAYTAALRLQFPAYMLKLISSVIVVLIIFIPYILKKYPMLKRRLDVRKAKGGR